MTRLAWLTKPAVEATASAVLTSVGKLAYLRNLDAHALDLSMLPAERRRFLATVGRRSTVQALMRREERRYPILLALVAQSAVDQLDEVIALFDQAVSARESRARTRTDEELVERAKKGESRQLLMDVILPVLADPSVPDEQVGGLLRERIGMSVLRDMVAGAWKPLPRDHGRLSAMDSSYSYLRQFTPRGAGGSRLHRRPGHGGPDDSGGHPEEPECQRGPEGPRRRACLVRVGQVRRLPGEGPPGRRRHRLPALLGAVRDPGATRRAAVGRHLRARVTPLR
jgi:hypothetical protein